MMHGKAYDHDSNDVNKCHYFSCLMTQIMSWSSRLFIIDF